MPLVALGGGLGNSVKLVRTSRRQCISNRIGRRETKKEKPRDACYAAAGRLGCSREPQKDQQPKDEQSRCEESV